jgi:hypothetical protein
VTTIASETRTYGNWIARQSPGLFRLGMLGTAALLFAIVTAWLLEAFFGLLVGTAALILFAPLIAPLLYRDKTGSNGWQIVLRRAAWRIGVAKAQDVYLAGLVDTWAAGSQRLPGLLANSVLHEFVTATGIKVGMVQHSAAKHYAVSLRVQPDGSSLVDQSTVDQWVAHYGAFLADLSTEPGLVGASVTVETSPDPGNRLAREVDRLLVPTAPALAQAMLTETAQTYPNGAASVVAWVTLTYTAWRREAEESEAYTRGGMAPQSKIRTPDEMATLIASRLPGLREQLAASGAGVGTPMAAQDLTNLVRVAYDPDVAEDLDAAEGTGEDDAVDWDHAGPAAARESWASYRHDGAASIVWTMTGPPRQAVESRVLTGLLAPHADVHRKRVTIAYRPYEPGDAAAVVDSQVRTAWGRRDGKATQDVHIERAELTAREEANGAGLTRFSLIVTSTVADPTKLGQAGETSMQLGRASKLTLRRAYGCQAATFAAGLGIGVLLSAQVRVPAAIRDYI